MHRLSGAKACFLSDSTEDTPKPDELLKTLDEVMKVRVISTDEFRRCSTDRLFGFTRDLAILTWRYM